MDLAQVNKLRRSNEVPFMVITWLEELRPIVEHDEFGTMYRGCVLAEDGYGKFTAIIGTTDQLLQTPLGAISNGTPYRILKVEQTWQQTAVLYA